MYMGGTYDDVFYIKSLYEPKGNVTIKVTAEGADGKESEAAAVTRNFDEISAGLTVEKGAGVLNASWTNPDMDYASIRADVTSPTAITVMTKRTAPHSPKMPNPAACLSRLRMAATIPSACPIWTKKAM